MKHSTIHSLSDMVYSDAFYSAYDGISLNFVVAYNYITPLEGSVLA